MAHGSESSWHVILIVVEHLLIYLFICVYLFVCLFIPASIRSFIINSSQDFEPGLNRNLFETENLFRCVGFRSCNLQAIIKQEKV